MVGLNEKEDIDIDSEIRSVSKALDLISSVEVDEEVQGKKDFWKVRYIGGLLSISRSIKGLLDLPKDEIRKFLTSDRVNKTFKITRDINFSKKHYYSYRDIEALLEKAKPEIVDWWSQYEDKEFVVSYVNNLMNVIKERTIKS